MLLNAVIAGGITMELLSMVHIDDQKLKLFVRALNFEKSFIDLLPFLQYDNLFKYIIQHPQCRRGE